MTQTSGANPGLAVGYILKRMPRQLSSDVIRDGEIGERLGIAVTRTQRLGPGLVIDQQKMFAAFRRAADGQRRPTIKLGADVGKVSIAKDGAGVIASGDRRYRFDNADLLATSRQNRTNAIDRIVGKHSLSIAQEQQIRFFAAKPDYDFEEFEAILAIVDVSPEAFAGQLRASLQRGNLSMDALVPYDAEYWNALVPVPMSANLSEFVEGELRSEWEGRLAARPPSQVFRSMSLTFAAPELVPYDVLSSQSGGTLFEMLEGVDQFGDPFALVGGASIALQSAGADPRLNNLGLQLIQTVVKDPQLVENALDIYGVAFLLATSFLAQHEELRERPTYWRRLAAAAHAALVTQNCGPNPVKQPDLLDWAWGQSGPEYMISVILELGQQPRWLPEWIAPNHLIADVYGRVATLDASDRDPPLPQDWKQAIALARQYLEENHLQLHASYPALLQGALPVLQRSREDFGELMDFVDRAKDEPTLDNFLRLQPLIYVMGFPPDFEALTETVMDRLLAEARTLDDQQFRNAMSFLSAVAVQLGSTGLADRAAELVLAAANKATEVGGVFEAVLRLAQCSIIGVQSDEAAILLAGRLDRLALALPGGAVQQALASRLVELGRVSPTTRSRLSRALARARLGGLATDAGRQG